MGLGDHHHAGDPERVELVKDDIDDGGLGSLRRLHHRALHGLKAVEDLRAAVVQLEQEMTTQTLQIPTPFLARDQRRSSNCDADSVAPCSPSPRTLSADAIRGESRLNYRALRRPRKEKMLAFYFRASDDDGLPARETRSETPFTRRGGRCGCSGSR